MIPLRKHPKPVISSFGSSLVRIPPIFYNKTRFQAVLYSMKHSLLPIVFACAAALHTASAQQNTAPDAAAAAPQFKKIADRIQLEDGDHFVFLGDSITHQCLYTQYVEDFFFTRFPGKRIHFHNAGVGGDRANNALARFDKDVAAYKPKYVTVLLGMNDGSYDSFKQDIFDTYQTDMSTLLDRIAQSGAQAILMTPTMHDARAARLANKTKEPRDTYYNGVLALFGMWLQEQAQVRGLGFVNLHTPLCNLTLEQRRTDPNWTMIKDAVHPGPAGQFVMASTLITDLFPRSTVSQVVLSEKNSKWSATAGNAKVTDLEGGDSIRFTLTANALPWVVPADAAEGYKLTHAGHKLSNEKLSVRNLKPGMYELKIDGTPVGRWTDGQLAFGVELEENDKTPQHQQALEVAQLNTKRNSEAVHPLRGLWAKLKGLQRAVATHSGDAAGLESKKLALADYEKEMSGKIAELETKARELENQIYQINQPKARHYELVVAQ
jgi:lysophospholipase L1-like esterase